MKSYEDNFATLYTADAKRVGEFVPERSVHTCVTSPPFYGLRSYLPAEHPNKGDELGAEATPEAFVENLVEVFRAVRRVLRDDATLWINLGDSYLSGGQLAGMPWRFAFAMQDDGWTLRSEIIWQKPNPMPESVRNRPTSSTEKVFLFSKSPRYFYDQEAVREPHTASSIARTAYAAKPRERNVGGRTDGYTTANVKVPEGGRNMRNLWRISTRPYRNAHFAVFPPELPERCIRAGTSEHGVCSKCLAPWVRVVEVSRTFESGSGRSGNLPNGKNGAGLQGGGETMDVRRGPTVHSRTVGWEPTCSCEADTVPATVLDPFAGSGTTLYVARSLGRRSVGLDLDERSVGLLEQRMGLQGVML